MEPVLKTEAIVTRAVNYRDSDRMLTLFSGGQGRLDVWARGCRKANGRLLSCSQPFCYGEYLLKNYNERYILAGCDIKESFFGLSSDIGALTAGTYLLNLAEDVSAHGECGGELFSLLLNMLTHLSYGPGIPVSDIVLVFLTRLMALLGFYPEIERCVQCGKKTWEDGGFFDPIAGGTLCARCGGARRLAPVRPQGLRAIECFLKMDLARLREMRLSEATRQELVRIIKPFVSSRIERAFPSQLLVDKNLLQP